MLADIAECHKSREPEATVYGRKERVSALSATAGLPVGDDNGEQARGNPVDKRTDVWAFGCVLFEMLTGKQSFVGETASDTLAGILKSEPEWDVLPETLPFQVERVLRRCSS